MPRKKWGLGRGQLKAGKDWGPNVGLEGNIPCQEP